MGLLDYLARRCGCYYLSDLNADSLAKLVPAGLLAVIAEADATIWSCDEWKEAVFYMTGQKVLWNSVAACRGFLLERLEGDDTEDAQCRRQYLHSLRKEDDENA